MNIISRRSFLERVALSGAGLGLTSMMHAPLFIKRALAEGSIGLNGKKILFIFLRGANDGLNSLVPVLDPSYYSQRASVNIPKDGADSNYAAAAFGDANGVNQMFDPTVKQSIGGSDRGTDDDPFLYANAIPAGNGFAGVHPSLKFLVPVYNSGKLAMVHRVGYPRQSRSHFDSQIYWENGIPGANTFKEGIFYRAMLESGLTTVQTLTGVSFQNQLPLILRGSAAAMTNLADPNRFSLLGVPDSTTPRQLNTNSVAAANAYPFPDAGANRDGLKLQYENLTGTLQVFSGIDFTDAGNTFYDTSTTDRDDSWSSATRSLYTVGGSPVPAKSAGQGYTLFPHNNDTNGGFKRPSGGTLTDAGPETAVKYVIPTNQYGFMRNLKAAALVLGKTNAIVAGTEIGGFDTHNNQVSGTAAAQRVTGAHANLQRTIGWSMYALWRFFNNPTYSPNCNWNNVVIITMTEFGRTSAQNTNLGTDHAEAGMFLVAGGGVTGGVYACNTSGAIYNGQNVNWTPGDGQAGAAGQNGTMFVTTGRYLQRAVDFRSILGEIIRDHLGATQNQLNRIIPGYAKESQEHLLGGGTVSSPIDSVPTTIAGELNLV